MRLFNAIAPIYGLFYPKQKRRYKSVVEAASKTLDLSRYESVIDIGCGTGALCSVLSAMGLSVTGVDPAKNMLKYAKRHPENHGVRFLSANVLDPLPFADQTFDLSIASYVAHGLQQNERQRMYAELCRITKSKVIIYDYNEKRSLMTSLIEWLERGDYFRFILSAETEMKACFTQGNACFSEVTVLDVDARAAWYVCTPRSSSSLA
jgi:ubiquinone/menaquinone biosynthesis C-methylase UbiE